MKHETPITPTRTAEPPQHDVAPVNAPALQQARPLYAPRVKIHPRRAEGRFRRLKWIVMAVTLAIYYLTPWIRWDRGPHAPDQAVLVDLANRRFHVFFIEIWPQEFFFVAGLLIMAGIGLFLVTSVLGRAWCGYACPQTVWTDLFLWVERAVEGDRNARIRLDAAPWSAAKIGKRALKHAIWLAIALATGGAWVFYFADAPTLAGQLARGDAPTVAYLSIAILTATTYTFGGLMREQVCIYMCPWPRIQAAMLDASSLTVTYNDWRGEPRTRGIKKAAAAGVPAGDCIDCNACVAVCPMGIDIRDGQQMACITCALCIDACDEVMDKVGRPRGLIAYASLADYQANMAIALDPQSGRIDPARVHTADGGLVEGVRGFDLRAILRPRVMVYAGAWALFGLALLAALLVRDRLDVTASHDRNPVFVRLSDGSVRNGYTVRLSNMRPEPRDLVLRLAGLPQGRMTIPELADDGRAGTAADSLAVPVAPDATRTLKVFVTQPAATLDAGTTRFRFELADPARGEARGTSARFEAPETSR